MYLTDIDTAHINIGVTTDTAIPFDMNFIQCLEYYAVIHLPCQG